MECEGDRVECCEGDRVELEGDWNVKVMEWNVKVKEIVAPRGPMALTTGDRGKC